MRQVIQICGGIFCTMKKETGKITSTYGETRLGASVQVRLAKEDIFSDLDSAYRSIAEQQQIVDDFTTKYSEDYVKQFVAVPGYSEHHTG